MVRGLTFFSLFPLLLYGLNEILPEAPKTFSPWFTGPLLAPSPTVVPVGSWDIQPYFIAIKTPASYDNHWKTQQVPSLWSLSWQIPVWIGLTNWCDIEIQPAVNWNHKPGAGGNWTFGDLIIQADFQLYLDELPHKSWIPSIKFAIREAIPTGKYRNLNPKKSSTDIGGAGSSATALQLVFGRIFSLSGYYYISSRLSMTYTIPAPVHVKGWNAYGGGYGANGTVYPGKNFQIDLGLEISLSRNWAFAFDLLGVWQNSSRFSGNPGILPFGFQLFPIAPEDPSQGSTAINDTKAYIQYSVAPAVEYNFNENFGFIAGTWLTVAGKNVGKFYSSVFAFNYYK